MIKLISVFFTSISVLLYFYIKKFKQFNCKIFSFSAAHCFQEKFDVRRKWPRCVTAFIGKYNLGNDNERGSQIHRVWDVFKHEDWNYEDPKYDADIAVVVLETKVDFNTPHIVGVVCLPPANIGEVSGKGTVVGWGIIEKFDHRNDETPKKVELQAISNSECLEADDAFKFVTSNRTFCAGFINQGKSSCGGDGGGGFYVYDESTETYTLVGINSEWLRDLQTNECRTDTYLVLNDVAKYANWIQEKMEETKEIIWNPLELECSNNLGINEDELWSYETEEM